jgi:hypothetical protein
LFGAQPSNPWVDLYEHRLNFHLRTLNKGRGFENRSPKSGEAASYGEMPSEGGLQYARIALLTNPEPATRTLIITGMGMPETEAAAMFALAPDFLERLPSELRRELHTLPHGLELLLSATRVGVNAFQTQVEVWRVSKEAATPAPQTQ